MPLIRHTPHSHSSDSPSTSPSAMKTLRPILSFILLPLSMFAAANLPADSVPTDGSPDPMPGAVGLTLSGGGAKGIAHIGVIQALEENGIPIDCITEPRWARSSAASMRWATLPPK